MAAPRYVALDNASGSEKAVDRVIQEMQSVVEKAASPISGKLTMLSKRIADLKTDEKFREKLSTEIDRDFKKPDGKIDMEKLIEKVRSVPAQDLQEWENAIKYGTKPAAVAWPFCLVTGSC